MPVTATLSRAFYERLGDDITNELVNWLNAVDESYRTDLRELNELNYARFEARLDAKLQTLKTELHAQKAELIKWMFVFWAPTALGVVAILVRS